MEDLTLTKPLLKMERTKKTEEEYSKRMNSLVKICRKELGLANYENLSLKQFVGWFLTNRNFYAVNTFKQYKASINYYIFKLKNDSALENQETDELEELIDLLNSVKQKENIEKPKQTSTKKQKKFPVKDFVAIISYLSAHEKNNNLKLSDGKTSKKFINSKFNESLKNWLYAGILTGVRPVEWAESQFIEYKDENNKTKYKLLVKNAKNTNGRAHGDYRTLHLDNLSKQEIEYIKKHVETANYWQDLNKYNYFKDSCSGLLNDIGLKLWKNRKERPSLYSLRHQFAADAKATGLTRVEIAAIMGHAVDDTATIHYAKKKSGNSLCRIKADNEDVLRVKQVYDQQFAKLKELELNKQNKFDLNNK